MDEQQFSNKEEIESVNNQILMAYENKQYDECLKLIEGSSQADALTVDLQIMQVRCWTMLKIKRKEIFERLERIIKDNPINSEAIFALGAAYYYDGMLLKSVHYFRNAINLNPSEAMQKAADLKQKALSAIQAMCVANECFENNELQKALNILSTAMFIDQSNDKIQKKIEELQRGFIEDLQQRIEYDVMQSVRKECTTLKIQAKSKTVHEYIHHGKFDEAETIIQEIAELDPRTDLITTLRAYKFYMSGLLKEAIPLLQKISTTSINYEAAKNILDKAIKQDKLYDAAATKSIENNYTKEIKLLTKLLAVDESNRKIQEAAYFQRALAHFAIEHYEQAIADFKMFKAIQNAKFT